MSPSASFAIPYLDPLAFLGLINDQGPKSQQHWVLQSNFYSFDWR